MFSTIFSNKFAKMLSNISYRVTSILIAHEVFKFYCPKLHQKLLLAGMYNTIYLYSRIQLIFEKYLHNLQINNTNCFDFIDNGEIRAGISFENNRQVISRLTNIEPLDYDFIIYEHDHNRIMYFNIPLNLDYIVSDVKFITFKVCYNCINYDIEL